jgi:hypothetical protein
LSLPVSFDVLLFYFYHFRVPYATTLFVPAGGAQHPEIDFVKDGGVKAKVTRITYLGNTIDYRVMVGETEVRIQKNRMAGIMKEGAPCRLAFNRILWYDGREGK